MEAIGVTNASVVAEAPAKRAKVVAPSTDVRAGRRLVIWGPLEEWLATRAGANHHADVRDALVSSAWGGSAISNPPNRSTPSMISM